MENKTTKQPLILAPQLPLVWTVCWLVMASVGQTLGRPLATGSDVQESVLLLSAAVLVANIYNLVLLYQRPNGGRQPSNWPVIAYALVLICSTVLAWGQPRAVLLPRTLAGWPLVFLLLNCGQAGLGIFLWQNWPRREHYGGQKVLSLVKMPLALTITTVVLPPALAQSGRGGRWAILASGLGLLGLLCSQWHDRQHLLARGPVQWSAGYQVMLGGQLAALLFSLVLGGRVLVQRWLGEPTDLVAGCFAISVLVVELTAGGLAALPRYQLQYQYGRARSHRLRYRCLGAFLLAGILVVYGTVT